MKKVAERNLLVVCRIGEGKPDKARIRETGTYLAQALKAVSQDRFKLAFSDSESQTSGFFIRSDLETGFIRATISGETSLVPFGLCHGDSVFVCEIGDWDALGFSNGWNWLQHH